MGPGRTAISVGLLELKSQGSLMSVFFFFFPERGDIPYYQSVHLSHVMKFSGKVLKYS